MNKYLLLLCIPSFLLCECKSPHLNESSAIEQIYINPNHKKSLEFFEKFELVNYVELSTSQESLISGIDRIQTSDEEIAILDQQFKALHIFNEMGLHISSITENDKLKQPMDIALDTARKCVFILDYYMIHEFYYLENKIVSIPINHYALSMKYTGDREFLLLDANIIPQGNFLYSISLKKGHKSKGLIRMPAEYGTFRLFQNLNFESYNGMSSFCSFLRDTIFTYNKEKLTPKIFVDFGKYHLDKAFYNNDSLDKLSNVFLLLNGYCSTLDNFIETDDYYYFSYLYNSKHYRVLYDKQRMRVILNGNFLSTNNQVIDWDVLGKKGNTLVLCPTINSLQYLLSEQGSNNSGKWRKLASRIKQIDPYSNPIVLYVKLRNTSR